MLSQVLAIVAALSPSLTQALGAADPELAALVRIEQSSPRAEVHAGEPFEVAVTLLVERQALEHGLLQVFQTSLDVPVRLDVPWIAGNERLLVTESATEATGATLALGDALARARRAPDRGAEAAPYAVYEIVRTVVALDPGPLELGAPSAAFAHAKGSRQGITGVSIAIERRDAVVHGAPLAIEVRALPEQGRPVDFSGAVGRFAIHARVAGREVELGQSIAVEVTIERLGSSVAFGAPPLARVPGFHVRGVLEHSAPGRLIQVVDLAPASAEVAAIPPIELCYFDPGPPGRYARVATEPILIRVLAPPAGNGTGTGASTSGAAGSALARWVPWLAMACAAALVAWVVLRRRAG
jgi:hypothetical protein